MVKVRFQLLLYSYDMVFLTFQGSLLLHGRCDAVGLSRRADVAAGREEKQPKRRQLFRERFGNTKNCQELTQDLFWATSCDFFSTIGYKKSCFSSVLLPSVHSDKSMNLNMVYRKEIISDLWAWKVFSFVVKVILTILNRIKINFYHYTSPIGDFLYLTGRGNFSGELKRELI